MIIDDDFLLSQYPTSINWNLDQNFNKKDSVTKSPNLSLGDEIIKYINEHFQEDIQIDDMVHLLCYFLRSTYCSNIDLNKKWTTKKS